VDDLKRTLRAEAMPGTNVGSGWTNKAVRQLIAERFGVAYSKSGCGNSFAHMGGVTSVGGKLYIRRDPYDQARYELETQAVLAKYARTGKLVVPLASDQSKVYLEGTLGRRWNPIGEQPVVADGARQKRAEICMGGPFGHGCGGGPFAIDWQDSDATIRCTTLLDECPQGQILLWQDQAPHHTSERWKIG